MIVSVKQVVRFLTERNPEEVTVQLRYPWVDVRLTHRLALVFLADCFNTRSTNFVGREPRLTTSANTPAWAGHDFDEVRCRLAGTNLVYQLTRMPESMHDGNCQCLSF